VNWPPGKRGRSKKCHACRTGRQVGVLKTYHHKHRASSRAIRCMDRAACKDAKLHFLRFLPPIFRGEINVGAVAERRQSRLFGIPLLSAQTLFFPSSSSSSLLPFFVTPFRVVAFARIASKRERTRRGKKSHRETGTNIKSERKGFCSFCSCIRVPCPVSRVPCPMSHVPCLIPKPTSSSVVKNFFRSFYFCSCAS